MKPKYVVDTSMLLRRNEHGLYDEKAFPVQWQNFDKLVEEGLIVSIDCVERELTRFDYEDYKEWINNHKYIFKKLNSGAFKIVDDINQRFPKLSKENNRKKSIADIPLVAYAKYNKFTLVTQETYNYHEDMAEKKIRIPTLCELEGAKCTMESCNNLNNEENYIFECIDFIELIKRESLYKP